MKKLTYADALNVNRIHASSSNRAQNLRSWWKLPKLA